jgi:WD40 repeat protein
MAVSWWLRGKRKGTRENSKAWNTESGELSATYVGGKNSEMIAFSPDGLTMAMADIHGVDLWSTLTWTVEQRIAVSPASALSVAFFS